ncbi:thioredoxin family protein [Adhaeribacter arboris]|uniref:Thioredoxin family protein n=1 Tax=Adhaeribacter arboris TaxID=2072846 RepID=A0A2T2YNP8_9BACT|nr:redoxin domain-containing protein [Adhaeribacter arboris]PSR57099.1 thioredoxin family protein [Adhaeribacter arboris]
MKKIGLIGMLLIATLHVSAQTSAPNQKVESFTLQGEAGQNIALADFAANKAVVVVFTNDHCPYSRLYTNRLQELYSVYSGKGVKFLFIKPAISTDNAPIENPNSANKVSSVISNNFPYVTDANQKVSQQLGATKTPEVFVIEPQNGNFLLRYKGAIDDNPQVESYAKETYLKTAIEAILTNQAPAITQKRATGCTIKRF